MEKHETSHVLNRDGGLDDERAYDRAMGREDAGSFRGNVKLQVETWHSGRGDRSVAASIIPIPGRNRTHDMPKNPLMVFRNMTGLGWACFACGWLAWFCDG